MPSRELNMKSQKLLHFAKMADKHGCVLICLKNTEIVNIVYWSVFVRTNFMYLQVFYS